MPKNIHLLLLVLFFTGNIFSQSIQFTIDVNKQAQVIDNIGSSGAWFTEGIGKSWPSAKKERLAELLFSKQFDAKGNLLGIGLSTWRFNIGGGTAEQGDSSGISNPVKRVASFLAPDGSYDWSKQEGYIWFVKKAAAYKVENLIAFSNTPPVQFTKNGLGFNLQKDYVTNLKEDKYTAYADFLVSFLAHFNAEGIHFNYVSPVNEPQWDWSAKFGKMNQEGSPWHNKDIYSITEKLDSALSARKLSTKILLPEAGMLTYLYEGSGAASRQIQQFYSPASMYYTGKLHHVLPVIAGHSYFSENGDSALVNIRTRVRDTAAKYSVPFWQTEYCMLGDGYKDGKKGKVSSMDCALFLSKVIHHDFAVANATAWHFWNSWEPGSAEHDTRYYLIALQNNPDNTTGDFTITKNLWALGHYSRFIRPGMYRVITQRSDGVNEMEATKGIMLSAYTNKKEIVVVAINYKDQAQTIDLKIPQKKKWRSLQQYTTTAAIGDDMKPEVLHSLQQINLPARSITTFIVK